MCTLPKQEKFPRATKLTPLRPLYEVMFDVERPLVEQVRWLYDGGPTFQSAAYSQTTQTPRRSYGVLINNQAPELHGVRQPLARSFSGQCQTLHIRCAMTQAVGK